MLSTRKRKKQAAPPSQEASEARSPNPISALPEILKQAAPTPPQEAPEALPPNKIFSLPKILSLINEIDISQQPMNKAEIKEAQKQVEKIKEGINGFCEKFSASIENLFNIYHKSAKLIQTFTTLTEITRSLDCHIERLSESLYKESTNPFVPNGEEKLEEQNEKLLAQKEQLGQLKQLLRKIEEQTDHIETLNELRSTLIFIYRETVDNNEKSYTNPELFQAVEKLPADILAWFKEGWMTKRAKLETYQAIANTKKEIPSSDSWEKARFFERHIAKLVGEPEVELHNQSKGEYSYNLDAS